MKIRCMIVDDEPLAHKVLVNHISKLTSLELVKNCTNAYEALSFLHQNEIDLIFLDIKMPDFSGLDMLNTLRIQPQIIFTTAFTEYALEGYEQNIVDYLLKPISFERFLKAINKVKVNKDSVSLREITNNNNAKSEYVFFKENKVTHKILFSDINYLESYGNYIKIYNINKMIMIYEKMHEIESKLPNDSFIRIHKSFIINFNKLQKIESNKVYIANHKIPIGQVYKAEFQKLISRQT